MNEMHKFGIVVVPLSWLIGGIATVILAIWGPDHWWMSYLLGLFTALLNFGLMMKSNNRFAKKVKEDSELVKPRKMVLTGYGIRVLIVIAVFAAIAIDEFKSQDPRLFCIPAIIGYLTLKFIVIFYGLIKRGKVNS